MASSCSFSDAVSHALEKLGLSNLSLKEEQGRDVFVCLPTGFGKSQCYQVLPFVMDHKLGLTGSQKTSAVLVVSPLIDLMVDILVEDLRYAR